jgi:hypothetical protein
MRLMTLIIIIVIVLVVLVALGIALMLGQNRRREHQRSQAAGLRQEATGHVANQAQDEAAAREKAADAERARAEADRLEAEAQERQRSVDMGRAHHEDTLREADRIDPDVDTRSADYTPGAGAPATETTGERTATEPAVADPAIERGHDPAHDPTVDPVHDPAQDASTTPVEPRTTGEDPGAHRG